MTKLIQKQLAKIEQLIDKGEFKEALEFLKTITTNEELSSNDQISCSLLECRIRVKYDEPDKTLKLINNLLEDAQKHLNPLIIADALIIKAEALWRAGNLDEGLETIQVGQKLLKEIDSEPKIEINKRLGRFLHHSGIIYWYKGAHGKALDCHQKSLRISEEIQDKKGIADSLNNVGLVYWSKGKFDQAVPFYQRSLEVSESQGYRRRVGITLTNLGNIYTRKGDLEKGLHYHRRALAIKEDLDSKHDIALSLINLGVVFQLKGDLNQAQKYYQRSLDIVEELGLQRDLALAVNNLGNIYLLKGDLDLAIESFFFILIPYIWNLGLSELIILYILFF